MSGTALSNFTDFMKSSPSVFLTDNKSIVNEAVKQTYVLGKFLKGRDMSEVLQGGSKIKDEIMFDDGSTASQTLPGATHTWQNPQVLTEWEINWRFTIDHMAWNKYEFILNNYSDLTTDAKRALFKKMQRQKEMRLWTSTFNWMEEALWRVPSYSEMEAAGGQYPYSIPVFINEFTNGYPGGTTWSGSGATIMGINPATESLWRPNQTTYSKTDLADTDGDAEGLFDAFGAAFRAVRFVAPKMGRAEEYFEQDAFNMQHIFASETGMKNYGRWLRAGNDRFVTGPQDPGYGSPKFQGVPVEYIRQLDGLAVYDSGSNGFATEAAANHVGPRFYMINGKYMKSVLHKDDYFQGTDPMTHPNQPDTRVRAYSTTWNLVARSRQRHAIISPTTNT